MKKLCMLVSFILVFTVIGMMMTGCNSDNTTETSPTPSDDVSSKPDISTEGKSKDQIVISFANGMPETHAINVAFTNFIKEIEEKSNGQMTGVIYPNNQLGGDVTAVQGVQDGSIAMAWTATANEVNFVPELAVFDIPFVFNNREQAESTVENEDFMSAMQTKFQAAGLHLVGFDPTGYRWLSANREVRKLEDLNGLKIRTMENPYHVAFWKALGVTPTALANSERYTALQQGTVDGQENAVENAFNTKMYEVQDYFINSKHIYFVAGWVMNDGLYKGLSDENKAIFDEAIDKCLKEAHQLTVERESELLNELETTYGKTVISELDSGEYERWSEIAEPIAEKMVRKDIGDDIVDLYYKAAGK